MRLHRTESNRKRQQRRKSMSLVLNDLTSILDASLLQRILYYNNKPKHTYVRDHSIDETKKEQFLQQYTNLKVREMADYLLKRSIHIPWKLFHKRLIKICKEVIYRQKTDYYIYIPPLNSLSHSMTYFGVYIAQILELAKRPYFKGFMINEEDLNLNYDLLYIDDLSYSGSQLIQSLNVFFNSHLKKNIQKRNEQTDEYNIPICSSQNIQFISKHYDKLKGNEVKTAVSLKLYNSENENLLKCLQEHQGFICHYTYRLNPNPCDILIFHRENNQIVFSEIKDYLELCSYLDKYPYIIWLHTLDLFRVPQHTYSCYYVSKEQMKKCPIKHIHLAIPYLAHEAFLKIKEYSRPSFQIHHIDRKSVV